VDATRLPSAQRDCACDLRGGSDRRVDPSVELVVLSDSGSRILTGAAGFIILAVGAMGAARNNSGGMAGTSPSAFSGGESRMSPGARRFWAIALVLFGASLIVGSMAL
jgi:hypothetical protein